MNKDFLNRFFESVKITFRKSLELLSVLFKSKILPFIIKFKNEFIHFLKLVFVDSKKDNPEYLSILKNSFNGLVIYGEIAVSKIEIKLYEWKNKKITKVITRKILPVKKRFSASSSLRNLVYHIKYLSYRRLIVYSLIFILTDIFLLWFGTYRILYAKHYWDGTQDKKFFIKPGKNLDEILDDMKKEDIIASKFIFKVYVKFSGKENQVLSRRYLFVNGISNSELLNILTDKNMVQMEKFTLIEGLRIKQIAKIAENKLQLSAEKFISETENDSLINLLGLKGKIKNLEGFLFPDTYYLPLDVDEKGLVNIFFNEFRKRVLNNKEIMNSIENENKKLLDVVILASIIQGETNLKDEMPVISGVYYNRLRKRMKLEADPTIQYVLPDGPKPKLKYSDLKIDSPYNTYKYYGLPPGPINNPGLYAIKAAIEPDNNNFLFFVATGNGGHKFTETYTEHLKAVEEYKRNGDKKNEK